MASARDISGNFDIEIRFDSDIFPDVYAAEEAVQDVKETIGIFKIIYKLNINY